MGADPMHGMGPENLSIQGCNTDIRETAKDMGGVGMLIPTTVSSNEGGGI